MKAECDNPGQFWYGTLLGFIGGMLLAGCLISAQASDPTMTRRACFDLLRKHYPAVVIGVLEEDRSQTWHSGKKVDVDKLKQDMREIFE